MKKARYIVDANVIIYMEYGERYDKNCFPHHYKNFTRLINKGKIISLDMVKDEINKTIEGKKFCEKYAHMFRPSICNDELLEYNYNKLIHQFPQYFNHYAKTSVADPFLIVNAYTYNLCIITQEELQVPIPKNQNKYKIPTLVTELNGYCIDNGYGRIEAGKEYNGFGCINFSELSRKEELYIC